MIDWLRQLDDMPGKSSELIMGSKETEFKVCFSEAALTDGFLRSVKEHKTEIIKTLSERWNSEYAQQGYVWCFDCKYFDNVNCNHDENPFRTVTKCPQAPRKCQWYEVSGYK